MKEDICELFMDFHVGSLDIKRLNYGTITLLPKVKDVNRIQQFRPICFLNCLYKWFTKLLTMRLEPVAKRLVHKSQSAFIQGRNSMNGVMALHEILHETKRRKEVGVLLKIDFEKSYDKVHWGFLVKCFKARGFCDQWCSWLNQILYNGTVVVRVNKCEWPLFPKSQGGEAGGSPIPPVFNFVADSLTRMVLKAQSNGLIFCLIDHLIPGDIAIMQYADDTVLCLKNDVMKARNAKLLLYLFEQLSGLKINFEKSELILVGGR
jgi:hypothetical protein